MYALLCLNWTCSRALCWTVELVEINGVGYKRMGAYFSYFLVGYSTGFQMNVGSYDVEPCFEAVRYVYRLAQCLGCSHIIDRYGINYLKLLYWSV